jgi:hypothetical protein
VGLNNLLAYTTVFSWLEGTLLLAEQILFVSPIAVISGEEASPEEREKSLG